MRNWLPTKLNNPVHFYRRFIIRSLIAGILFTGTGFTSSAQVRTVTGKVTAFDTKDVLIGVNVFIKGTTKGTVTDLDGNYSIEVPDDAAVLSFSFIGYQSYEMTVGTQSVINVILQPEKVSLDEIVVIGYGAQKVKDLTAPITTVKGDELKKQVSANPMQALQGKVAGVQIINSGSPGSSPSVKIRGVGSIGDYANPLYVVDGVFMDNIDFLNSSDIEDLTVLKDASAAAIYGVRAANGVILVTTKKGKNGRPVVSYDGYLGLQVPVNIMPLANTSQYVTLLNEANVNTSGYTPKSAGSYPASTDWYKELVRNAFMDNHSLDISGGTEKTTYSFGGSYLYQDGTMNSNNSYQRFNLRGRLDQQVNNYLKIGMNTMVTRYEQQLPDENAYFQAFVNPPVYPVYDPSNADAYPVKFGAPQKYGFGNQYGNPYATAYYNDNSEKGNSLLFTAYADISIIKNKLSFKTSYNQELGNSNSRNYTPQFNVGGSQGVRSSSLSKTFVESSNQIIDNLLTFNSEAGGNHFTLLLGQSTQIERIDNLNGSAQNVPGLDEQSKYLYLGSSRDRNTTDGAVRTPSLSYFTRGTYNYQDRFLATLTFRADGSSKYQDKWGYFPSVGLGWILTKENLFANMHWLQYLKVRASWGQLGNNNVPANSLARLGATGAEASAIFNNVLVDGLGLQTVYQNYLKWEVVNEFDLGADFAMLQNKLSGNIDYYRRVTNRVVFSAPIPTGGGVVDLLDNNGKVLNSGIEVSLNWSDKITEKSSYHVGMNLTTIHNEVLALNGRDNIPAGLVRGNYTTLTQVGEPIGSFYGYEIARVYSSEVDALKDPVSQLIKDKGYFKYVDQNNDKKIDAQDKVFLGSAIPKLTTGIYAGIDFQNFDFSLSLQGQFGNKILNAKRMNRDVFTDGNYDQDFYNNRWTTNNKNTLYPSAEAYNYSYTQQANDFFVESGSYIRLQNVQAGYTVTTIKNISKLRVYITAQNPFTFFKYHGFTPEIGGSPIAAGIDNSIYPMHATYNLGFNVTF